MAKKKGKYVSEEKELDQAFHSLAGDQKKKEKKPVGKTATIITICAILILLAAAVLIGCLYLQKESNTPILQNVSVAGVDVGGMVKAEAIEAVEKAIGNGYATKNMVVRVLEHEVSIPASCSGGVLDVKAAVREACRYGHFGFSSKRRQEQETAAKEGYQVDLSPYMQLDETAIRGYLAQLGEHYSTTLTQSTYEITGAKPSEEDIAAGKVEQALVIKLGVPEYGLNLDALYQQVTTAYSGFTFFVEGDCKIIEPDPIDLEGIHAQHYVAPVDAHLEEKTYNILEGTNGYGFDLEEAKKAIESTAYGETVSISFKVIPPAVNKEAFTASLFRDTLSTYTAENTSKKNTRDINLRLACEAINGLILNPGQTFSYNDTLGERTAEKGYKPASAYSDGQTVDVVGGGICQVSSTLYNCVLLADLEIVYRINHSFASSYVPLGMDATVSWGSIDFEFRNDTDSPIKIEAFSDGGNTTVTLKGIDSKDYYIEMEHEVIGTTKYSTTYKTMAADNKEGYKDGDYITTPYTGYKVKTYRCKYNKQTKELISKEFEADSTYKKRDAVICKIESQAPADNSQGIGGSGGGITSDSGGALPN